MIQNTVYRPELIITVDYWILYKATQINMAEQAQVALRLCMKHQDEEIDLYCKVCKKPICNECMKSEHMGHDFDTIAKLYRKMKNSRPELIRELEGKITPKRNYNRRHLLEIKYMNKSLLGMNLDNVEKKRKEMYEAVDKIINAHVTSMKTHNAVLDIEIKREEEIFEREESGLIRMLDTFRETTMVGLDFIEYYEELKSKADALETIDLSQYLNKSLYMEGEVVWDDLQKMIGEVKEISSNNVRTEDISSFQHKDALVHTISPISHEEAWMTYVNAKEFTLFQREGQYIKSVPKDTDSHSFIIQKKTFLLCNQDRNNILKVDISGKLLEWLNISPLVPRFIGRAVNGKVLVSLVDEISGSRAEKSERKVQMVSLSGDVVRTYEYGDDGTTRVFTLPNEVTQNYNSDVCVVNQYEVAKDDYRGNVCVFYEDGGLKFVYSGHDGEFCPIGICCDSLCNIICSNLVSNTIHVISSEGVFVKYLFTRDTCLPDPTAVSLHRGVLWVGSAEGEVRVYRYKY